MAIEQIDTYEVPEDIRLASFASVQAIEAAIIAEVAPACEDCSSIADRQAQTLACFVGIGRISVESAIQRVNERVVCTHLGSAAILTKALR